jgi:predicted short-subunit dehydrogenase-like oxidoreductase (DUF2520 family)
VSHVKPKIVLIGAGNVATHLGQALGVHYSIVQVVSRNIESCKALADKLGCASTSILGELNHEADIYIISVSDDAIADVASELNLPTKIVVHTSGSVSLQTLATASENTGVFYPLQTFSKAKAIDFAQIPICIEASNSETKTVIEQLARSISNSVQYIDSEQRKTIHLAAIFACNFSNHFYGIAETLLKEKNIPFDILKPLIVETANKIKENSPRAMQTGPAIRGDYSTINKHLEMLENAEYKMLYELLSKSIAGKE